MAISEVEPLEKARSRIGKLVRELRIERAWSQKELADRLALTQPRLSEIERGRRSLTAEQLLRLLQLTNTSVLRFLAEVPSKDAATQNALIRFGASHLVANQQAPAGPDDPTSLVVEVLSAAPPPRHVVSLAPVLVRSADSISLAEVAHRLRREGRSNRLGWLVESIRAAIDAQPSRDIPERLELARAATLLELFEQGAIVRPPSAEFPLDVLDRDIRTLETASRVFDTASPAARRWRVATRLTHEDFSRSLRDAHDAR